MSLRIKGQVQGVFYRQTAREQAHRLGLTGWVRNRPDGDVEAVVEGPPAQTEAFVAWCQRGPPAADVVQVEASSAPATGEFSDFQVRR